MDEILNTAPEIVIRYGVSTIVLILIVIVIRMGIHHSLFQGTDLPMESRRRWAVTIRNILLVIFILGSDLFGHPRSKPLLFHYWRSHWHWSWPQKRSLPVLADLSCEC